MSFTPDGKTAAVLCKTGVDISLIDVGTGTCTYPDDLIEYGGTGGIAIHPTNNKLYMGTSNGSIYVIPAEPYSTPQQTYSAWTSAGGDEIDIEISSDGKKLYAVDWDNHFIEVCSINQVDGTLSEDNEVHPVGDRWYVKLSLSPDDKLLYVPRICYSNIDYMETSDTSTVNSIDIAYNSVESGQRDVAFSEDSSMAFVLFGNPSVHTILIVNTQNKTVEGKITLPECEAKSLVYKP
jgi:DNA-binding beta-propeller fold protein YncE